jgi:predicted DCC family thiol-disulfide oxidoreductase YuxK
MGAIDPLKPVVLFDGICNLCSGAVLFIIKHDRNANFLFAPLQSPFGQSQLIKYGLSSKDIKTILLIKKGEVFSKSEAALEIARHLNGGWPALYVFKVVPLFIRNVVYDWIAKNRYRWFGKQEACMVPTPELKARFLS